jgi:ClpP class serine protease
MVFTFDIWTVLVVIFLIILFIPIVQQRALQKKRLGVMRSLELKRRSRVMTLIHRQETMSLLGIPIIRYIDINDSEEILRAIRLTPEDMPIDFIVHTPGGLVLSSEQIAMALRRHKAPVTVFVPHYAMSGGTLLCLAAHEVIMDENAVLGPVDPQVGEYPASSILRVIQQKSPGDIDDKTFILSDIAEKAQTQMKDFIVRILHGTMDDAQADKIALSLTEGRWTHDYPITYHQAKERGLPVTTEVPHEIYLLMDLFPQAMQRRPSVEYIPVPYQKEGDGKNRRR